MLLNLTILRLCNSLVTTIVAGVVGGFFVITIVIALASVYTKIRATSTFFFILITNR